MRWVWNQAQNGRNMAEGKFRNMNKQRLGASK